MAVEYRNECVGCPTEMGCLGLTCPNRNVPHLVCDECGCEVESLRVYEDEQICEECLLDMFPVIEIEE